MLEVDEKSTAAGITLRTFNASGQTIPPVTKEIRWEHFIAARGTNQPNELIIFFSDGEDDQQFGPLTERSRVPTEEMMNS